MNTIDVSKLPQWAQERIAEVEEKKQRWVDRSWTEGSDTLAISNGMAYFNDVAVSDRRQSVLN